MNKDIYPHFSKLPPWTPSAASFFLQPQWFALFERCIGGEAQAQWLTTQQGEQLQSLPMLARQNGGYRSLHSMSNFYSPEFTLLTETACTAASLNQFVGQFAAELKQYDSIHLLPLKPDQAQLWQQALSGLGFHCHPYQHSTNWYQSQIQSVQQYWQQRPSRLLHTLERKGGKIRRNPEYQLQIFSQGSRDELIQALIHYHHCYRNSWKNIEPNPGFIDAIAEYAWQQGQLRLGLVFYQQQPVAAQLWFVRDGIASIFKLAHHQDFTRHSVGSVLTAALVDHVIAQDNIHYLDFLTGDDDYKKDWMDQQQPLYGLQASNLARWRGQLSALHNLLSVLTKPVRKDLLAGLK